MDNKDFNKKKMPASTLRKYMHPRNPYKTPPSFKKLAIVFPEFRKFCTYDVQGRILLDFKDPLALKALAIALLEQDFGLKVQIPDNRLVPTLPLRLNYLLWIEDLLGLLSSNSAFGQEKRKFVGYDIGTGAACVYPLLGNKHLGWRFLASESDNLNFEYALKNIQQNGMEGNITLKNDCSFYKVLEDGDVKKFIQKCKADFEESASISESSSFKVHNGNQFSEERESHSYLIDFTMCNPPFFSSEEELDTEKKTRKERSKPTSAPTGVPQEKVVEGGEVAFIEKMIRESVDYKHKIRLFSSLIGQQKDVRPIKSLLSQINPSHFKFTEFCQGRTMRWGVAWTFDPSFCIDKNLSKKEKLDTKPLTLFLPRTVFAVCSASKAWQRVSGWLKELKIKPNVYKSSKYFVGAHIRAYKKTWLHQRRKRREEARKNKKEMSLTHMDNCESSSKRNCEDSKSPLQPSKVLKLTDENMMDISKSSIESQTQGEDISNEKDENVNDFLSVEEVQTSNNNDIDVSKTEQESNCPSNESPPKNLDCLLRGSICLKQTQGLLTLEITALGGTEAKESLNQLMQYFKNKVRAK